MYSKEILMDSAGISNRTLYTFITGLICEMFVNYVAYCRRFPCHFFCTYIPPKHKTHGHLQKKNSQFQAAHLSQGMYWNFRKILMEKICFMYCVLLANIAIIKKYSGVFSIVHTFELGLLFL